MNPKNTLTLALTLGLLVLGLYIVRTRSQGTEAPKPKPPRGAAVISRKLIEDPPGEVIKINLKRPGRDEWVFEKKTDDSGSEAWRMTAPQDFKVTSWEVEKMPRQLGSLMYDISYQPGESGAVSAESAGLAPPHAVVTMSDKDGKSTTVEIGGPAGKRETYVRLVGDPRICVGKSSLTGLFKEKAVEYRGKSLWSFDPNDATRVEIEDRSQGETKYLFTRDGARWMIESPVAARATPKVQEAVAALAQLRVTQWQDDDESQLPIYGLAQPAMTLRVTTAHEVKVENAEPKADDKPDDQTADKEAHEPPAPPKTEIKTSVFVLHVADRSPIGEDTKVYVRAGDEPAVATIMKTTIDKIKPNLSDWRDRKITPVDVTTATSFELVTPHGSLSAKSENGSWQRTDGSASLDDSAIAALLKSIHELSAVAYAKDTADPAGRFGFDHPQATMSLMTPSATAPERIVIGAYTNSASKQLVYVRHNDDVSVAKARSADVTKLMQDPIAYVDHAVFHLAPATVVGLTVESDNPITRNRQTLQYTKHGDVWSMTAPTAVDIRQEALEKLSTTLTGLRATRVVATAEQSSAYGLHDPAVVVTVLYDLTPSKTGDDENANVKSVTLLLSDHEGKIYAKRKDATSIFELDRSVFDRLVAENANEHVWSFDAPSVSSFSVKAPNGAFTFNRREGHWVYAAEPDLPLDDQKVEALLLRIRDIRVTRVADYVADDLAAYGLDRPAFSLSVTRIDKTTSQLAVATPASFEGKVLAHKTGATVVVLLEDNATNRFSVALDSLERQNQ